MSFATDENSTCARRGEARVHQLRVLAYRMLARYRSLEAEDMGVCIGAQQQLGRHGCVGARRGGLSTPVATRGWLTLLREAQDTVLASGRSDGWQCSGNEPQCALSIARATPPGVLSLDCVLAVSGSDESIDVICQFTQPHPGCVRHALAA